MINIPAGLLSPEELVDATGIKARDLDIEFTGIKLEKKSLVLIIGIKLNFVMPLSCENLIKNRIMEQTPQVKRVKLEYHFIAKEQPKVEEPAPQREQGGWNRGGGKSKQKMPPRTGNALWGRGFNEEPISYAEALSLIGQKKMVVLEGEAFDMESKPIKNDRTLFSMGIAGKGATFGIKAFIDNESKAHIDENLKSGDIVQVKGFVEYDTWDHMNILSAKAIKKADKQSKSKKDTYPNGRRVELHIHSKFSDNDGFNDAAQIVKTAASWGQPAVAITDHGVVQGFPDAANCAKKLKKDGKEIKVIFGLEGYLYPDDDAIDENGTIDIKKHGTYHIIILAKNKEGLKNMYKLVSLSHIDYFYKKPRIPRSVLQAHREGLIIGSACEAGELYQAIRKGADDERLEEIAAFYDYLEIQPLGNNQFMIEQGLVSGKQDLIDNNLRILGIADKLGKLCVATTDSHYPTPEDAIYRNIIMKGIGFKDTESDNLYMRTTDEMMEEFSYLGDRAEEVVVTNTNLIADMCEEFMPVPEGKYPPKIEGAEETLRNSCYEKAKSIYGDPLPQVIVDRLEAELVPIIREGYAVMYVAAKLLVEKSMSDGYLVGSRGSVGSSFAATMAGITEVNPLDPHYVCPECKHFEFTNDLSKYDCGFDMPEKDCPKCGTRMHKDGLAIPFATFLGFEGNKEPDIDLNFAGEYQPTAHKYVGVIFGEKNVYKAGTVATLQDKTAFGYVKHYFDDKGIEPTKYDISYMVNGCMGVKRTTGQHPGGIIVVPDDHEIYEFCPVQKPANKRDVDVITTHFDYHKIDQNLLKLDILGHDAPQLLRHLQNLTGVEPMSIPFDDKDTLSIFTSLDALNITNPDYKFTHGTYAIPEFGTNFTRGMLDDIKPTTVSALIKMSGFSHGTLVWQGNGQDLIRNGTATIDELISSRDDIMRYLILKGIENGKAFKIMEKVRKNKELSEEELELMKSHGVPDWYIWSCRTLTYLFPRAHASAYVMMSIRMAWFKINYPQAFYAAYFTSKIDDFDAEIVFSGYDGVYRKIEEISALGNSASAKQKTSLIVYEVIYEMLSRGYEFAEPELGVSNSTNFLVIDGKVKLPFMAIEGIGRTAAESLGDAYEEGEFFSLDDVKKRTKLSGNNIESLKKHGLFKGLPDTAQVSIFDLF